MTLVFGATGFLGKTFFLSPLPGFRAITRSVYDFTQPSLVDLKDAKHALILAAISSPDDCVRDPVGSHAVNVTGTIALLRQLKDAGVKPVFFSTDHVFDGEQGNYTESDEYSPITLYGRQKAETETFIRENFTDYLILRTSKQVAMRIDDKNTLSEMALKLRAGQKIRCATDNWVAPSFVEDIVEITRMALPLTGVFHIAPSQQYSRLELGWEIADAAGASRELVEACSIQDFKFAEVRPPRCTLDGSKLRAALGFQMTPLRKGLRRLTLSF